MTQGRVLGPCHPVPCRDPGSTAIPESALICFPVGRPGGPGARVTARVPGADGPSTQDDAVFGAEAARLIGIGLVIVEVVGPIEHVAERVAVILVDDHRGAERTVRPLAQRVGSGTEMACAMVGYQPETSWWTWRVMRP